MTTEKNTETLIAEIPKSSRECIRVTLSTYLGHTGVNLRVWWKESDDDPTWKPSKRGIWIPVDDATEVADAIEKTVAVAKRQRAA